MIELTEEIIKGIMGSKAVRFLGIWIGIILGGWIITQLRYNFLKFYVESYPFLSGFLELINFLPIIFCFLGLITALEDAGLIRSR